MAESSSIPVIGIVGGIGAGKTFIAAELGRHGCLVIDADHIGHELLRTDDIRKLVVDRWGEGILDKDDEVDRHELAEIVFADPTQREELEAILHPLMRAEMEKRIAAAVDVPAVVIDAAILFEAGWDDLCSHTLFVDAPAEDRYRRVGIERGWSREEFDLRESAQIPLDTKAERCFYTVVNHSDMSRLSELVKHIFQQIVHEG